MTLPSRVLRGYRETGCCMRFGDIEFVDEGAEFFPNGSPHDVQLVRDIVIQGLPCAGGRSVVFFPNGRLKLAWLTQPTNTGGIPCGAGIVYLHENGAAANTVLTEAHGFQGVRIAKGARVRLDEDGRLMEYSTHLPSDCLVAGLPCAAARDVWLYPNGRPSFLVLAKSATIDGRIYPRGSELSLNEDGAVLDSAVMDLDGGPYKQRLFGAYELPFV
jgi:hypothetical protein